MRFILKSIDYPEAYLDFNGTEIVVKCYYSPEGEFRFVPAIGWDQLEFVTNTDPETLLDEIDELLYNVIPERFQIDAI